MILHGDLRDVLPGLDAERAHACVTDPPYELGFMGKAWDRSGIAFQPETWAAVFRVLKPGGHLLAFGGSRTAHRIAAAQQRAFGAPGLTLLQCNGKEGGQTVGHFHIHVVPRHADDGVGLLWPRKDPPRAVLEATAAQLRAALED